MNLLAGVFLGDTNMVQFYEPAPGRLFFISVTTGGRTLAERVPGYQKLSAVDLFRAIAPSTDTPGSLVSAQERAQALVAQRPDAGRGSPTSAPSGGPTLAPSGGPTSAQSGGSTVSGKQMGSVGPATAGAAAAASCPSCANYWPVIIRAGRVALASSQITTTTLGAIRTPTMALTPTTTMILAGQAFVPIRALQLSRSGPTSTTAALLWGRNWKRVRGRIKRATAFLLERVTKISIFQLAGRDSCSFPGEIRRRRLNAGEGKRRRWPGPRGRRWSRRTIHSRAQLQGRRPAQESTSLTRQRCS